VTSILFTKTEFLDYECQINKAIKICIFLLDGRNTSQLDKEKSPVSSISYAIVIGCFLLCWLNPQLASGIVR